MPNLKKKSVLMKKIQDKKRKTSKTNNDLFEEKKRQSKEVLRSVFGEAVIPPIKIQKTTPTETTQNTDFPPMPDQQPSTSNTVSLPKEHSKNLTTSNRKKLWIQKKRQDKTYKEQEMAKDVKRKQPKRKNQEYTSHEQQLKKLKLACPEMKEKEKQRKRTTRTDPQVKIKERDHKRKQRTDLEVKTKERDHKRKQRTDLEVKTKERDHKRKQRTDLEVKTKERDHKRKQRTDLEVKTKERDHKRKQRTDLEVKTKERDHKRKQRTNLEVKTKERDHKRKQRTDLEVKTKERDHKRKQRTDLEVKTKERDHKRKQRTDLEVKTKERDHKRKQRTDLEVKTKERDHKRKQRTDLEVKTKERDHKRKQRTDLEVKTKERDHKRKQRTDLEVKTNERDHKSKQRTDLEVKTKERDHKRKQRTDLEVKTKERDNKRKQRTDLEVKTKERDHKRKQRTDPQVKTKEQQKRKENRSNPTVKQREKMIKQSKKPTNFKMLIDAFHNKIKTGPVNICTCCQQLMYKHSVIEATKSAIMKQTKPEMIQLLETCFSNTKSVNEKEWLCTTCSRYLKKSKMPPSAVANKMDFPNQGPLKSLNPLELTLLSPMLPFMKIHQAPAGNQYKIHGNMVVVPSDTVNTVQSLPRLPNETATIKAKLKIRLRYEHHVYSLNTRPEKIRESATHLSNTGELYKSLDISYNINWTEPNILLHSNADVNNLQSDNQTDEIHQHIDEPTEHITPNSDQNDTTIDSEDEWNETDTIENNSGNADTLLTSPDFIEANERDLVYSYAPAENKTPVSVFTEKTSEEQSFPGIFCGNSRVSNVNRTIPVTYGEIVKSELRRSDRRCAKNVENIFFKTKKLQMKYLIDQTNIALRKVKTAGMHLTAKDVRNENAQQLIHLDQGYKVLRTLRGSPPYFQAVSKDLFAMIRQLGPATFFCTLSAAETQWLHLLRILGKLLDDKDYTDEQLQNLTWQEKSRLIQSDPVTCTRHFDYSLQCFMNDFLLSDLNPIGKITDYFYRIEFQQRGSPHVHMMVWCAEAPNFENQSQENISAYIDKYVTCQLPQNDDDLSNLIKYQTHKHSKTCKRKGRKECRFKFPKPPIRNTQILFPLEAEDEEMKDQHLTMWKKIHAELINMQEGQDISFEDFLLKLTIKEEDYIKAIRSSISTPTVFLKRSPMEIRINSYNSHCLKAWRANMDLQFVIDVYACAIYIASYVTKTQRGMSKLLQTACKEANTGNKTIKQQVRIIGNKFLNAVEISAQEACYLSLQLPLKRSSRQTIFIKTSPPDHRVILLKPQNQLSSLHDDDDEIECKSLITRYAQRPKSMENLTLAEFASSYEKKNTSFTSRAKSLIKTTTDGFLPDPQQDVDNLSDDANIPEDEQQNVEQPSPSSNETEYRKRKKPKIIRTVHFNPNTDQENYHRELLMLYSPWRNEDTDLIANYTSYTSWYKDLYIQIEEQQSKFEPFRNAVTSAETLLAEQPDLEQAWDSVAPNTQHTDQQHEAQTQSNNIIPQPQYDIGPELGLHTSTDPDLNSYNELSDENFRKHMRLLNKEQIQFVYHIVHQIKTHQTPIYHFLSGGAGVGKSFVTKALYQMILKYFNRKAGDDFTTPKVLLMAPTGKAAYHIHGNTIHSTLRIPANQKLQHKSLDSSSYNTLQNKIGNVELIFIDEISMVGFKLLNCIHQRLMEIKQSKKPFGGVSIIAVGDLFQLKPVMDSYIFKTPNSDYMPLASNLWENLFKMTELNTIMRQRENKHFAELLNRLREGNHTTDDITLLKTNLINATDPEYPYHIPHVFISSEKVNNHNANVFLKSDSTKATVEAKDKVIGNYKPDAITKILDSFKTKIKDAPQLPTTIQLAENLQYEITINLNCDDGLINGASCILKKINLTQSSEAAGILWVQFNNETTGQHLRQTKPHLYTTDIPKTWTPIEPTSRQYTAGYKGEAQVQRLQLPLRPAAAKTIHRSQGDTLDEIIVDLTTNRKIDHIHYVALSRVTSLKGLHIRQLQENKISINCSVQEEMQRLKEDKPELSLQLLHEMPNNFFKVVFLNANSLNKHLQDVKSDFNLNHADIVGFCETRFIPTDTNTTIPNFNCYRQDSTTKVGHQRPSYGLAVYCKRTLPTIIPKNINSQQIEMILLELQNLIIIFLYKPPRIDVQQLINHLQTISKDLQGKPVAILGDFNIDWSTQNPGKKQLSNYLQSISYRQLIQNPTTDDNTTIDLIFTNIPNECIQAGTLEVFYSPHKPIWIALKTKD